MQSWQIVRTDLTKSPPGIGFRDRRTDMQRLFNRPAAEFLSPGKEDLLPCAI
ncbi:hypothetical protein [Desulfobulbus sp.]|uniref:hypothetical protein n=1 Tax=Desulfobulbus sp. TaxID=895 RepID=UPI00286EDD9F|nr:hypothetical protein [Desulfobulbus sp.]